MTSRFSFLLSFILVAIGSAQVGLADNPKGHVAAFLRNLREPVYFEDKLPDGKNRMFRTVPGAGNEGFKNTINPNGMELTSSRISQEVTIDEIHLEQGILKFNFHDKLSVHNDLDTRIIRRNFRADAFYNSLDGHPIKLKIPTIEIEVVDGTVKWLNETKVRKDLAAQAEALLKARKGWEAHMVTTLKFNDIGDALRNELKEFQDKLSQNDTYLDYARLALKEEMDGTSQNRIGGKDVVERMWDLLVSKFRVVPRFGITRQKYKIYSFNIGSEEKPEMVWVFNEADNNDWREDADLKTALGLDRPEGHQNMVHVMFDKARISGVLGGYLQEASDRGYYAPMGLNLVQKERVVLLPGANWPPKKTGGLLGGPVNEPQQPDYLASTSIINFLASFGKFKVADPMSVGVSAVVKEEAKLSPWLNGKDSFLDLVLTLRVMEKRGETLDFTGAAPVQMTISLKAAPNGEDPLLAETYSPGDSEEVNQIAVLPKTPESEAFTKEVVPPVKKLLYRALVGNSFVAEDPTLADARGGKILRVSSFKATKKRGDTNGEWTEFFIVTIKTPKAI